MRWKKLNGITNRCRSKKIPLWKYSRGVFLWKSLVIVFVFFAVAVDGSLSCHLIAFQILIIGSDLIDDGTVRQNLDDSVCGGLYDLMVTGGKEKYAREL